MAFVAEQLSNMEKYSEWFVPTIQASAPLSGEKSDFRIAKLVTTLGTTSDLIEINVETPSYIVFRKQHTLRLIRGVFPEPASEKQVICFKLAKEISECSQLKIFIAQIASDNPQDQTNL